jgi:lauroyl/myristoyl acyltransferase
VSKIGLRTAGLPVVNLRSFIHPYSDTIFGRLVLNRIRNRIEDRYLRDSVALVDGDEADALQKLQAYLDQNVPVAIAASGSASRPLELPFLGGTLRLALGAPALAVLKAAPLLPTFTVPNADHGFDLVIEPPIQVPADGPLWDRAEHAARAYAQVLETYVTRYPTVWRGWFAPATWLPSVPQKKEKKGVGDKRE